MSETPVAALVYLIGLRGLVSGIASVIRLLPSLRSPSGEYRPYPEFQA